jgi:hypothetical protein
MRRREFIAGLGGAAVGRARPACNGGRPRRLGGQLPMCKGVTASGVPFDRADRPAPSSAYSTDDLGGLQRKVQGCFGLLLACSWPALALLPRSGEAVPTYWSSGSFGQDRPSLTCICEFLLFLQAYRAFWARAGGGDRFAWGCLLSQPQWSLACRFRYSWSCRLATCRC